MFINDKKQLRELYKSVRSSLSDSERVEYGNRIFSQLINSSAYRNSLKILVYVSVGSEVDTREIINYSLRVGKTVAVPVCIGKNMFFSVINSVNDLIIGAYGIPSVREENICAVNDFDNSLCIVPALSFDAYGNRLGYGGGYYDRFLSDNDIFTIGICYERCISYVLPCEEHDIKVDYIMTEKSLRNSKKEVSTYG